MFCKSINRLTLQWHITARCNQRCKHCYQEYYSGEELSFRKIINVMEQYKELLQIYSKEKKSKFIRGHINITGGEPFFREDFLQILESFSENKDYFSFGILTNGSFIDNNIAKQLKKMNTSHVQVSIDGNRNTHDNLRGKGNFQKTWKAVRILRKHNIRTLIAFTAHKGNYKEFSTVAGYSRKNRASKLWTDRFVPMGNGENMSELLLSNEEALEYFDIIVKEKNKWLLNKIAGLEVYGNRALQFLKSGEWPYSCSAGDSLITILENGQVLPCRRLPIHCGNILKDNLCDIYFNSNVFKELRENSIPKKCRYCLYSSKCKGGAKCMAYAILEDFKETDPGCPFIKI